MLSEVNFLQIGRGRGLGATTSTCYNSGYSVQYSEEMYQMEECNINRTSFDTNFFGCVCLDGWGGCDLGMQGRSRTEGGHGTEHRKREESPANDAEEPEDR